MRDFLATNLPAWLDALRAEWNLTAAQLPNPVQYSRNPVRAIDKWPVISLNAVAAPGARRSQVLENDQIEYTTRYGLQVYVWVRAQEWDNAIDQRDDLTTATTSLILANPTFNLPDEQFLLVEENRNAITESYSDITPTKQGDRFICGALIAFAVDVREVLSGALAGTVESTRVIAAPLQHPAL